MNNKRFPHKLNVPLFNVLRYFLTGYEPGTLMGALYRRPQAPKSLIGAPQDASRKPTCTGALVYHEAAPQPYQEARNLTKRWNLTKRQKTLITNMKRSIQFGTLS